jgi:hypothetical protein
MWYVDPLLSGDREMGECTAIAARQQPAENSRELVFSVLPVRCYIEDSWNNELVVGQSTVGKNVSTEAENIVEIPHQATTGEDTAD